MARKSVIAREIKRERIVAKYAKLRLQQKEEQRLDDLHKLPKKSAKVRLHNRCTLTGIPKGYMRQFGLCRNQFRDLALAGKIPGVTKASW